MQPTNKENKGREIIALMLKMATKDDQFDEKEFSFILQVSSAMNISIEEIHEIMLNLDDFTFTPPHDEAERMTILYYLLFSMKSDGKVKQKEVRLIQKLGFRLGFRQELTNDLIQQVKMHAKRKLPAESLLERLRIYMN